MQAITPKAAGELRDGAKFSGEPHRWRSGNPEGRTTPRDAAREESNRMKRLRGDKSVRHFLTNFPEGKLAERGGFEPPIGCYTYNGLANRPLRPLGHLSESCADQSRAPVECKAFSLTLFEAVKILSAFR